MTSAVAPGAGAEQSAVRHGDVQLFRGIEFAAGCDVGLVQLSLFLREASRALGVILGALE